MRVSRSRLTVRGMMLVVAIVGVICLGGREFQKWHNHQRKNPVRGSELSVEVEEALHTVLVAGQSFPVSISYNFKFSVPMPPAGTSCLLYAMVWFADAKTGDVVASYTFDAGLKVGGREAASGALTWNALIPRPGRYYLCGRLMYQGPEDEQGPQDDFKYMSESSSGSYLVEAAAPPNLPPNGSGANP